MRQDHSAGAVSGFGRLLSSGNRCREHTSPGGEALRNAKLGEPTDESTYPATKGKAGGKLPAGNRANRSPDLSFADASRNWDTNQA